jgi:hypothetical protein
MVAPTRGLIINDARQYRMKFDILASDPLGRSPLRALDRRLLRRTRRLDREGIAPPAPARNPSLRGSSRSPPLRRGPSRLSLPPATGRDRRPPEPGGESVPRVAPTSFYARRLRARQATSAITGRFFVAQPRQETSARPPPQPPRPTDSRRPRSRTRSSDGSPHTTRPSASRRAGGRGRSSRRASAHPAGSCGG